MASETTIINTALRRLGDKPITDRLDGTPAANVADTLFDDVRDALLRAHPWNFATSRVQLIQSVTTPVYGYDYQYKLPTDWLRTLAVHGNDAGVGTLSYKMEQDTTDGAVIVSNANELWLRYVRRIIDPNIMIADFREALSYRLAADMALPITNSGTLRERLEAAFVAALRRARSIDGIEDFPDAMPDASWLAARV